MISAVREGEAPLVGRVPAVKRMSPSELSVLRMVRMPG
jgi:hypothetical protein